MELINCGRVSRDTHGMVAQPFTEGGPPPFNKYVCGFPGNPCFPVTESPLLPLPATAPREEPEPAAGSDHSN